MICKKANEKSVCISTLDSGEVEVFLITCSIKEAEKLYTTLEYRINLLTSMEGSLNKEEEGDKDEEVIILGQVVDVSAIPPTQVPTNQAKSWPCKSMWQGT